MASHLANIFGTEQDKVNCPFYFKIGACRHGDKCSRLHNRPTYSETLLLRGMYDNPRVQVDGVGRPIHSEKEMEEDFDDFYRDIHEELSKFGAIDELHVCDNVSDHMLGNVYVRYEDEEASAKALTALQGRFYDGKPLLVEYSPVTDFREARCRQFEKEHCQRGGYCNFLHLRRVGREVEEELFGKSGSRRKRESSGSRRHRDENRDEFRDRHGDRDRNNRDYRRDRDGDSHGERDRRRSRHRRRYSKSRSRSRSRERSRSGSKHRGKSRSYSRSRSPPAEVRRKRSPQGRNADEIVSEEPSRKVRAAERVEVREVPSRRTNPRDPPSKAEEGMPHKDPLDRIE